ncbi:MAG: hypothetical protein J2P53_06800 [Bradyrhizobiaceae bacterium]|nr:hypothetical protein [Bradyrhizobiaceae bacterium]
MSYEGPRGTLRDGKLYIDGVPEPYFRDTTKTIRLRVSPLEITRIYSAGEPMPEDLKRRNGVRDVQARATLRGIAVLEDGNRFSGFGLEDLPHDPIIFLLRGVPESDDHAWSAAIGYDGRGFWIEGRCTQPCLDDLLTAVRRGHAEVVNISMQTTMWTSLKGHPSGMKVPSQTWHVSMPGAPSDIERGNISEISWTETFSEQQAAREPPLNSPLSKTWWRS